MNRLSNEKRRLVLGSLLEGGGIRGTSRLTGTSKGTVARLLKLAGHATKKHQERVLRNLDCDVVELDEMHSFVHTRRFNIHGGSAKWHGERWVWIAVDRESRAVVSAMALGQGTPAAVKFTKDVSNRLTGSPLLCTDGNQAYPDAMDRAFGGHSSGAAFGAMIKPEKKFRGRGEAKGKWVKPASNEIERTMIFGNRKGRKIGTSRVERMNLHLRTRCRRFNRRTSGHSKSIEFNDHAISLWQWYTNFCEIPGKAKVTPAQALGITHGRWGLDELLDLIEEYEAGLKPLKN